MNPFRSRQRCAALCAVLIVAGTGQTTAQDEIVEEVIVTGHPLSAEGLAQPNLVLQEKALEKALAASIGETLVGLPSINSSSFGQAVGRPVIRGQGGARVKVLEDRIDVMDVSVTSPDHAVTIDSAIADRVEVLMGPSTLLYGSGAIGGVVDVHTGRIPHTLPTDTEAKLELRGADNADRRSAAGKVDTSFGALALHIDGFYREADDYEIPGFAESSALRAAEEEGHGDEDHDGEEHGEEEGEVRGELPGSDYENYGGAIGLSYVGETGFAGIAFSAYEAEYGLPGHAHEHEHGEEEGEHGEEEHSDEEHGEEEEEGNAILDLEQQRIDFEAGLREPLGGLDRVNLRLGYNDYEHTEFEPDGASGTTFSNEALEGRLEAVHNEWGGLTGAFGLQYADREFSALGEEAFVQPVDTDSLGLFYVGQTKWRSLGIEGGLRYEDIEHDPSEGRDRSFDLLSGSIGLILPLTDAFELTGQLDYSERAPIAIELYSDGAHLATQSYELGDPNLDKEQAFNVSAGLKYSGERLLVAINAYYTDFEGFIYEQATGDELDDLPVLEWRQEDAQFVGADLSAEWMAASWSAGNLSLTGSVDAVEAELDEGANKDLPRIPPLRWSVGARLDLAAVQGELVYTQVDDQNDTAPLELPTEGFEDLRLYLEYGFDAGQTRIELFLLGTNLTDDEQRYHTSFIKDLAPQPGRTFEAGVRIVL